MGDTIILSRSNEEWALKRKIVSSSFYKDKLMKMVDIIKATIHKKIVFWEQNYAKV